MGSRESILQKVKAAQPSLQPLPELVHNTKRTGTVEQFQTVLESIGGKAYVLEPGETIIGRIGQLFPEAKRVVSTVTSIEQYWLGEHKDMVHQSLHDVDVTIIEAQFGVAENGAVWITEDELKIRVLPFICEHLVAVVEAGSLVATMNEAYARIGSADYGFGVFIAGPSKTADIEQSLVLGAHGPKTMTVFVRQGG